MNDYDPHGYRRKRGLHPSLKAGLVGGAVAISVNLMLFLINAGETNGDILAWLVALAVYFFAARNAAQMQYDARRDELDACRGVVGAGVGAAYITSALTWVYIIVRGVVRDAFGIFIVMDPFSAFCTIVIDVMVAGGLGAWGGRTIYNKYCRTFASS